MAKKLWTIKDGVYTLIEDTGANREKLAKHLSKIIRNQKDKSGIKGFKFGADGKPYRISTTSINELLENKTNIVKFKPVNKNRSIAERVKPGGKVRPGSPQYEATQSITKEFTDLVSDLPGHTSDKLQEYFAENDKLLRGLRDKVAKINRKLKETGKALNQRVSRGHDQRLSQSIDSPRNLFIELLDENIAKGDRYSPNPASSLVTGNPVQEGLDTLENWKRDYITWLDKPENGGSGALAQRGDYSDLLEQRIRAIGNDAWQSLSDIEKTAIIDEVDDLITNSEKLNQFLVSEGAERRKWGILNPDQKIQTEAWINSADYRNKNFGSAVTEVGGRLGGERTLFRHTGHLIKDYIGNIMRPVGRVAKPIIGIAPYVGTALAVEGMRAGITKAAENPTAENIGYAAGKTLSLGLEWDPTGILPTTVDTATELTLTPEGRKTSKKYIQEASDAYSEYPYSGAFF